MSHLHDYIPRSDEALVLFAQQFAAYAMSETGGGRFISGGMANELNIRTEEFAAFVLQARSGSHLAIQQKNEAKKFLVDMIRDIVKHDLASRDVTNDDRTQFGLPIHDDTRTTIPVPAEYVSVEFEVSEIHEIIFSFKVKDLESKARPYGSNGAVCAYAILDHPAAHVSELTQTLLATHSPYKMIFSDEDSGKHFSLAMCWQNEKGQRGDWSPIISKVIS